MNFNSRETYLEAIIQWKKAYAFKAQEIRENRTQLKEAQRTGGNADHYEHAKMRLKREATAMIEERHESKIEAHRQYTTNKLQTA